jgi:uncharacterized protein YcfJ
MLKHTALFIAASVLMLGACTAQAAECHRHHHAGTILGAAGGGVVGSVVTHGSPIGIVGGLVVGGLAGNAIARDSDRGCGLRHYRRTDTPRNDR